MLLLTEEVLLLVEAVREATLLVELEGAVAPATRPEWGMLRLEPPIVLVEPPTLPALLTLAG